MKFLDWVRKHIVASAAIVLGVAAIAVSGIKFLSHKGAYDAYLTEYNSKQEELKMKSKLRNNNSEIPNYNDFIKFRNLYIKDGLS